MMMMMMMMIHDNDNDNKIAEVSAIREGGVCVCWGGGGHTSLHDYTRMCHLTILKLVLWFYHGEQVVNGV